jgi:hypothetical protein
MSAGDAGPIATIYDRSTTEHLGRDVWRSAQAVPESLAHLLIVRRLRKSGGHTPNARGIEDVAGHNALVAYPLSPSRSGEAPYSAEFQTQSQGAYRAMPILRFVMSALVSLLVGGAVQEVQFQCIIRWLKLSAVAHRVVAAISIFITTFAAAGVFVVLAQVPPYRQTWTAFCAAISLAGLSAASRTPRGERPFTSLWRYPPR